jgi:hypothetical protein
LSPWSDFANSIRSFWTKNGQLAHRDGSAVKALSYTISTNNGDEPVSS